jgi:ADP-heptose:LPS heptosyltransferase
VVHSKIAVLRANAVGDFVFALPALEALRAAHPTAEIVLLGRAWHADFLADRPGPVDRVVVVPPSRGVNGGTETVEDPAELARFFAAMNAEHFDLALQLHGGGRHSNPFVRRLGARLTVGLRAADAEPLDRWLPYVYFQPEIARLLEVVGLAGAAPVTLEPRLALREADRAEAARVVAEDDWPLVLLHPGTTDPRRRWPTEKFAAVGDGLAAAGARVLVNGVSAEADLTRAVIGAMRAEAVDLAAGPLSLGGLTGLLARCAVVVSNDSGPLHLAVALGTPAVGIQLAFNLVNSSPLTRRRYRPLVSWQLACPVCGRENVSTRCEHDCSFVAGVAVEDVLTAALELFAVRTAEGRRR